MIGFVTRHKHAAFTAGLLWTPLRLYESLKALSQISGPREDKNPKHGHPKFKLGGTAASSSEGATPKTSLVFVLDNRNVLVKDGPPRRRYCLQHMHDCFLWLHSLKHILHVLHPNAAS